MSSGGHFTDSQRSLIHPQAPSRHGCHPGFRARWYPGRPRGRLPGCGVSLGDLAPRLEVGLLTVTVHPGRLSRHGNGSTRGGPGPSRCGSDTHRTVAVSHRDGYQREYGPACRWRLRLVARMSRKRSLGSASHQLARFPTPSPGPALTPAPGPPAPGPRPGPPASRRDGRERAGGEGQRERAGGEGQRDKYITGYIIRTMRGRRAGHTLKPR